MSSQFYKNCRCNICNKVSSGEVASDYGDQTSKAFYKDPDPKKTGFVCSECMDEIREIKTNWEIEDEV